MTHTKAQQLASWLDRVEVGHDSGCWLWTGFIGKLGYGHTGKRPAHRAIYEALRGPIPTGRELDHLCRVRRCVNPAHLEPVTHRENVLRGEGVAAKAARKTHCPQGHEYTPDNTLLYGAAHHRLCRTCRARRAPYVFDPARHKHGTGGYVRGCRCEVCTDANRLRSAAYRARQKTVVT